MFFSLHSPSSVPLSLSLSPSLSLFSLSPSLSLFSLSLSSEKHLILRTLLFLSSSFFHRFSKCTFKSNVNTTESIKVLCPFSVWPVPTFSPSLPLSLSLILWIVLCLNLGLPRFVYFQNCSLPECRWWSRIMNTQTNQQKPKKYFFQLPIIVANEPKRWRFMNTFPENCFYL